MTEWFVVVTRDSADMSRTLPPIVIGPYDGEDAARTEGESDCGIVFALLTIDCRTNEFGEPFVADDVYWTDAPPAVESRFRIIPNDDDDTTGDDAR